MKPTVETLASWLRGIEFDSPQDCYSLLPYTVNEYEIRGNSIYVDYEFLVVDSTIDGFQMFDMVDMWMPSQQFPKFINRVRLKELYHWKSTAEMENLSNDHLRETEVVEYSDEPWDSEAITDEFLSGFVDDYDRFSIGEALVENEGAGEVLPDYVPERLRPIFKECINLYKASN